MSEGIKVLTRDEVIKAVPERWNRQYGLNDDHYKINGKSKPEITRELLALQEHELTADRINGIIGNTGWTALVCSECREDVPIIAGLGDDPEWGGKSVNVCKRCLTEALAAIGEHLSGRPA